ncbi:MAG: TetR/AcrR family transcriptional regulator [Dehalococcoidia bacterium]
MPRGHRANDRNGAAPPPGAADLRQRIREVAYDLFGEHGYHGTTTRMIANALGVSVPALYYHYRNKQELLAGVMRMDIQEAVATLRAAVGVHESTLDGLEAAVRAHVQRRTQFIYPRSIHRTEMRFIEAPYRAEIVGFRDEYERVFKDLVGRARDEGIAHNVEQPSLVARAALQMMNGISEWYRPQGRMRIVDVENLYVRLVWNLLGIEEPPPERAPAEDGARTHAGARFRD